MEKLEGRVAVVTGGGSGIGEGLARACASAGMQVVCADVNVEGAGRVADRIRGDGGSALAVATDVTDAASVEELAEKTWGEFGACHLLCNNAGMLVIGPAVERSEEEWRRALDVNLLGMVRGIRSFVPRMRAQGGEAHILNTASSSGVVPVPGMGVYVASKFAVVGLSESLREDLAPDGIGVTVLCPGGVKTHLIGDALRRAGSEDAAQKGIAKLLDVAKHTGEGAEDQLRPAEVAEIALRAVRENALYAHTHALYRPLVEKRMRRQLDAFDRL